ncbi:MAG: phosphoheptose isomerase [Balneolaceae bacterium]
MLRIAKDSDKDSVFEQVEKTLREKGISIQSKDDKRPWGGFIVIASGSLNDFLDLFFDDERLKKNRDSLPLSPKILIVEPHKRLSWQYHERRSEIWSVVSGEVGFISSNNDLQGPVVKKREGDLIKLKQGERHRLIGLDDWGIIAEIWQHTDPENPSNEEDIIRVDDDFGR